MAVELDRIENFQEMEVFVSGPCDSNRLYIFTGTAVFSFKGTGPKVLRDEISFNIPGKSFLDGQVRKVVVTAGLSSIFNDGPANNAGWAIDSVEAGYEKKSNQIKVSAKLAVRDSDGYLLRFGFQATVLAAINDK